MRLAIPLIAVLIGVGPAHATASLSCEADDRALKLSAEAVVAHGMGEHLSGFRGEIQIRIKDAPEDFRSVTLDGEHVAQNWIHDRDVKLRLFREWPADAPRGSVELVLETRSKAVDETDHVGRYALTVEFRGPMEDSDVRTLRARGRATCSLG